MLKIIYQHPDGYAHVVDISLSEEEALMVSEYGLADRYAVPALALIQERIREYIAKTT